MQRLNLVATAKFLLIAIFVLFPFWEVLIAQARYFLHIPQQLFGVLKYSIIYGLVVVLTVQLIKSKSYKFKIYSILIFTYTLYIFAHIIGDVHYLLLLDGIKFEFTYPLIATLLLINNSNNFPDFKLIRKIVIFQGVIIIMFGLYELNDPKIIETMYRKGIDEIAAVHYFNLSRLISFSSNPINLGATIIIFLIFFYSYTLEHKTILFKFLFIIFVFLSFICVSATLSRTSFLVFLFVGILMFHYYADNKMHKIIIYIFLVIFSLSVFYILDATSDISGYIGRYENLNQSSEFSENIRVTRWVYAYNQVEFYEMLWGKGLGISTPSEDLVELYGGLIVENAFISIFVEFGLIGLALYGIIIVRYFYLINLLKKQMKSLSILFYLFLITYLLFSMGNDFNRNLPFNIYFWVFYAYLENYIYQFNKQGKKS